MFIFEPYTSLDEIHVQLGYNWREAQTTNIDSSETIYLLVFVKNHKVVRYYKWPRTISDFQILEGRNMFSPGDLFEVKLLGSADAKRLNIIPLHKEQSKTK